MITTLYICCHEQQPKIKLRHCTREERPFAKVKANQQEERYQIIGKVVGVLEQIVSFAIPVILLLAVFGAILGGLALALCPFTAYIGLGMFSGGIFIGFPVGGIAGILSLANGVGAGELVEEYF